ncbi:MAE_28990/MAE_18760 family HEPN-like nuclease [uncultured Pseudodesulfovibrio sp.]|uniref:MAE_28990/MAE_18760 family HEPN-like nuclease n=1 Tax=uncultured Pseudodesulfovibrio sp. TaxID=2035858 RepID=UPI0029C7019C|nr:MAE_28990/MAE_18760 family HEPN-like nuclease [uncultured Pseudodesulfovibrio sp.]
MARYTSAYSSLVTHVKEVEILQKLADRKAKSDPIGCKHEIDSLSRGAVVLLCAHLEGYIKELGEVTLEAIYKRGVDRGNVSAAVYYHISKDFIEIIKNTQNPSSVSGHMFNLLKNDLEYWQLSGPFPSPIPSDRFNRGFASPSHKKISAYFKRFGYDNFIGDMQVYLKAKYLILSNAIDHLVDTRNKIAHGDPSASKTPSELLEMLAVTKEYCRAVDSVFAFWCRSVLCCIR